jgi:hypothetical protein
MITVDQIRSMLQQVTLSKISLDEFDEWFAKASWNMHQDSSPEAIQLVGKIELRLAQADNEEVADEVLVKHLNELVAAKQETFLVKKFDIGPVQKTGFVTSGLPINATKFNFQSQSLAVSGKQSVREFSFSPLCLTQQ